MLQWSRWTRASTARLRRIPLARRGFGSSGDCPSAERSNRICFHRRRLLRRRRKKADRSGTRFAAGTRPPSSIPPVSRLSLASLRARNRTAACRHVAGKKVKRRSQGRIAVPGSILRLILEATIRIGIHRIRMPACPPERSAHQPKMGMLRIAAMIDSSRISP